MKIAEMTTKDLEYYINLVNEEVEGLRRLTSILKEVLQWVNAIKQHYMLLRNHWWMEASADVANFFVILLQEVPTTTPAFGWTDQSAAINTEVRPSTCKKVWLTEGSGDGYIF